MIAFHLKDRPVANRLKLRWALGFFGIFLMLAGCGGEDVESVKSEQSTVVAEDYTPIRNDKLQQRRANVGDECPKLVQKRVDHTAVSRQDSIMGNTCDYFIYPAVGDTLTVYVSDGRMKPFLNTPYYHDFANGSYKVIANGRHVIRLEYNALEHKPAVMDYVLVVNIASPK